MAAFGHFKNINYSPIKGFCEALGFIYLKAESITELKNSTEIFINTSLKPVIIECIIPWQNDTIALEKI